MTYDFFDTSVLVKLYCDEPGSRWVQEVVDTARRDPNACALVACDTAIPECVAASVHKAKRGESGVSARNIDAVVTPVVSDLTGRPSVFVAIESSGLMGDAVSVARRHGLTGADSVHLAAAIAARAHTPFGYDFFFAAANLALVRAARIEGFDIAGDILPAHART